MQLKEWTRGCIGNIYISVTYDLVPFEISICTDDSYKRSRGEDVSGAYD